MFRNHTRSHVGARHKRAPDAQRRGARRTVMALLVLAMVVSTMAASDAGAAQSLGATRFHLPKIRHVFTIVLENQGYSSTFGNPSADPYLAITLPSQGALLSNYYATGHESNDNYITLVSGQPPNAENQADCADYVDFTGTPTSPGGVATGTGCVYPTSVKNIGDELTSKHLRWKAYQEDMGNVSSRESAACGHPSPGSPDMTQKAVVGDGYAARHDPFVYFHSVIDNVKGCDRRVVALGAPDGSMPASALRHETGLATDLRQVSTTPNYAFITPNLCSDGHDYPCANQPNGASALSDIDSFLSTWVPLITSSPAFRKDGLLEITFDESVNSDTTACCGEAPGPGSPVPGITGPGGGLVGAVVLSPFVQPGIVVGTPYNHYSSLTTVEALFGGRRLGASATVSTTFGSDIFSATRHQ